MSDITATVSGSTITAAATSAGVSVTVGASVVNATASGGVGPAGAAASLLSDLQDVQIDDPAAGDVLRYSSSRWRNYRETDLLDGGNFG